MEKMIKGKGFGLRPLKKTDYKVLAKKINHRDIYRFTLHIPCPYKETDAKKWLAEVMRQYKGRSVSSFNLAIVINNEVSGCVSLKEIIRGHKAEIGYWLAEENWGQGIMTRAISQMVKNGFSKYRLKKIYAYVFTDNSGSLKALKKNGFVKEGLLIQHSKKGGKLKDEYILTKYKYGNRDKSQSKRFKKD